MTNDMTGHRVARQSAQVASQGAIGTAMRRYLRGLSHGSTKQIMEGHKALCDLGLPAISAIRAALARYDVGGAHREITSRLIAGLVHVLHDIDEAEAAVAIDRLVTKLCTEGLVRSLRCMQSFSRQNFAIYSLHGVTIFEAKELGRKGQIRARLKRWLANVPAADLEGISRLYVLANNVPRDYYGQYMPVYSWISIVWPKPFRNWRALSWPGSLRAEYTLYHEIGHHAHRHGLKGDQEDVSIKEREADVYAIRTFLRMHPWLKAVVRSLVRPLRYCLSRLTLPGSIRTRGRRRSDP